MATLADLKKRKSLDFGKITTALNNQGHQGSEDDSKFWKPERDKAGNGSATIRFLAAHESDELPWVKMFSHSFKGPTGRWYIENCLSTLNQDDPVNVYNKTLWAQDTDESKKQARDQKRKTQYISRILVIQDPKHPENNGKQFFFKYGKKIFDKIMDKAQPTFEDETPVNVFDLWEGADFKLRIKQVEGFPNYDASVFAEPSPVADSDEEILEIVNAQEALKQFTDPSKFKSYTDLENKLKQVLTGEAASTKKAEDIVKEMSGQGEPQKATPTNRAGDPTPREEAKPTTKATVSDDDVDDFFSKLSDD